ncbi:hypothetical protein [Candidatus Entotheonella palauensis]|uniref:DUF4403 family protein n=1 Tax=Candidatus Entotheonella gemina TaxID=1429439 RepID=W4MEW4_9BACT|nr:hypothetical protein [Candidatus Entotheonella palauensis]ETX08461.1 MAG: hypothetical protein ETSY2_05270 [Candidatus Entotheonella gemina]
MTTRTHPPEHRSGKGSSRKVWAIRLAGLFLLIAWVAALVVFTPDGERMGTVAIAAPQLGAHIEGRAGRAIPLEGRARRRSGCLVGPPEQRLPIRNGHFEGTFLLPKTIGRQLIWLDVECNGKPHEHYARLVQVNTAPKGKRAEIVRVHMSSKALHRWINRVFPPMLNKHIANYLEQKTRGKQKGLLELTKGGRIVIDDAWIQVIGKRLELKMSVDVNIAYRGKGIIKKLVKIPIVERLEPVTGTVLLTKWPQIELTSLRLESTRCKRYEARRLGFVSRILEAACKRLYRGIAKRIEKAVSKEASKHLQQIDPGKIVGQSLVRWAKQVGLADHIRRLVRGANFALSRGKPPVKRKDSLSFSISVSRTWLGRDGSSVIDVKRTSAPVDLGISVALINRVLSSVFDRDLLRVLQKLKSFSKAAGFDKELESLVRRLQQDGGPGASRMVDKLLAAAQLKFAQGIKVQPLFRVDQDGALLVFASDIRLLQARKAAEHAAISLTAAARVYPRSSRTGLFLEPDSDYLLRHIAFEPVSLSDTALDPRVHHRYAAFGNFIQDQLGRVGGWVEGDPLMDTAAVQKLLANFKPVPVRFETVGVRVEAREMRGDFANQVIVLRGRTRLK